MARPADLLNEAVAASRIDGEVEQPRLESAYLTQLRETLSEAVSRYRQIAGLLSLAAAADWNPPSIADVLDIQVSTARIRDAQRRMLARMAGKVATITGVDFDLTSPMTQEILDGLGARAEALGDTLREPVAAAIARGWAEGRSVPDTARLIQRSVKPQLGAKATMLARTDLIGMSNGAGQGVAKMLNEAARSNNEPEPIGDKVWLSSHDARVRDTHAAADGQRVPLDQPFNVGGEPLAYPGDPAGSNAETINCRCTELYEEGKAAAKKPDVEPMSSFLDTSKLRGTMVGDRAGKAVVQETIGYLDTLIDEQSFARVQGKLTEIAGEPKFPIVASSATEARTAHGSLMHLGRTPIKINIALGNDHPGATLLHEFGHLIDHSVLSEGTFATADLVNHPAMLDLLEAEAKTTTGRKFQQAKQTGFGNLLSDRGTSRPIDVRLTNQHKKWLDYASAPIERWARLFSQWASEHPDAPAAVKAEMRAQVETEHDTSKRSAFDLPEQWEPDEFETLKPLIEKVLTDAGVLRARVLEDVEPGFASLVIRLDPLPSRVLREAISRRDGRDDLVLAGSLLAEKVDSDEAHAGKVTAASSTLDAGLPSQGELPPEVPMTVAPSPLRTFAAVAPVDEAAALGERWHSDLAFEGLSTGDGRYIVLGALSWRDLPLTLMAMVETTEGGHLGAQVSGRIDTAAKRDVDMSGGRLPDGVKSVYSTGYFDSGEYGSEIERMVSGDVLRGVSVDMSIADWAFRDPETGQIIDPETATDDEWEKAFLGEYEMAVLDGTIMAATVCPTPAFADAKIALLASSTAHFGHTWRANAFAAQQFGIDVGQLCTTLHAPLVIEHVESFVASAGFPVKPPRDFFFRKEADRRVPLTFTEDGEVYGHLAGWTDCHTGYVNGAWSQCVTPPRSRTDYEHFHVGDMPTAEGDLIPIGKLMLGEAHAPAHGGPTQARGFYDRTGQIGCYVRATDGKHGIWLSGAIRNDLTDEQWRDLNANPPSGDWRSVKGNLELVAAIAVPVPGYPIPRAMLSLAASAEGEMYIETLILTPEVAALDSYAAEVLAAEIEGGTDGLAALIEG